MVVASRRSLESLLRLLEDKEGIESGQELGRNGRISQCVQIGRKGEEVITFFVQKRDEFIVESHLVKQ